MENCNYTVERGAASKLLLRFEFLCFWYSEFRREWIASPITTKTEKSFEKLPRTGRFYERCSIHHFDLQLWYALTARRAHPVRGKDRSPPEV